MPPPFSPPLELRPLVVRPLVVRLLVERPLVVRPLVVRPLVERPLVERPFWVMPLRPMPLGFMTAWAGATMVAARVANAAIVAMVLSIVTLLFRGSTRAAGCGASMGGSCPRSKSWQCRVGHHLVPCVSRDWASSCRRCIVGGRPRLRRYKAPGLRHTGDTSEIQHEAHEPFGHRQDRPETDRTGRHGAAGRDSDPAKADRPADLHGRGGGPLCWDCAAVDVRRTGDRLPGFGLGI